MSVIFHVYLGAKTFKPDERAKRVIEAACLAVILILIVILVMGTV